jgi:hypothetical protein
VTGSGVSVVVYAWAEDVKLSGPSVGLATQADEYATGPVSSPATTLATAASYFENIPVIGRFATATRLGAGTVANIASLFGFTNVPVIDNTQPFRSEAFPKMASSEIGFPVEKLTLDPKNELSIDPTIVGLPPDDELVLANLVQRESYLTSLYWQTSSSVDTILFTARVQPGLYGVDTMSAADKYYLTPMAWLGALFEHWRGDVIFTFRVVASAFHKGRLRISFDPSGSSTNNAIVDANTSNVIFTEVLDLGESNEVSFRVPYQQATSFLVSNPLVTTPTFSTSPAPTYNHASSDNGTLTVRIQTVLTAPVVSSAVRILVFVKGASNLEFANPRNPQNFTPWAVQSDAFTTDTLGSAPVDESKKYLVNFGESVKSLRQVLRRQTLVSTSYQWLGTNNELVQFRKQFMKVPGYYGYDPHGLHIATGLVTTGANFGFNYNHVTPLAWIMPAFIGYRGSTIWSFNTDTSRPVSSVRVFRINNDPGNAQAAETMVPSTGIVSPTTGARANLMLTNAGGGGQALTNQYTQAGINVLCPMFGRHRFQMTSPSYTTWPTSSDSSAFDSFMYEATFDTKNNPDYKLCRLWSYVGIGTDFNLHFFLNVPTLWSYASVPPPG